MRARLRGVELEAATAGVTVGGLGASRLWVCSWLGAAWCLRLCACCGSLTHPPCHIWLPLLLLASLFRPHPAGAALQTLDSRWNSAPSCTTVAQLPACAAKVLRRHTTAPPLSPPAALQVTLIDFTLSRLVTVTGEVAFCDLAADPELFKGPKGSVQVGRAAVGWAGQRAGGSGRRGGKLKPLAAQGAAWHWEGSGHIGQHGKGTRTGRWGFGVSRCGGTLFKAGPWPTTQRAFVKVSRLARICSVGVWN